MVLGLTCVMEVKHVIQPRDSLIVLRFDLRRVAPQRR